MNGDAERLADAILALGRLPAVLAALEQRLGAVERDLDALRRAAPPALVPVPEAARALAVSEATIRRRIRDGSVRGVRVGRSLRVDLSSLRGPSEAEVEAEVRRLRATP